MMAAQIRSHKAVALHVRFFDSPEATGGINNAPQDYYRRAIARMDQCHPGAHFYLFSDNVAAAKVAIPLNTSRITIVDHNQGEAMAYADLWLMTLCQHFIIANSTFSWWGAWLGGGDDKTVIAPGFVKRDGEMWWGFDGLLPTEWTKI